MVSFFQENSALLEEATEEKTLSIYQLIVDGGFGGQIIISLLLCF